MENLDRIFFINRKLKKFGEVSVSEIAFSLGVTEQKVREDVLYMNRKLNANIKYIESNSVFQYSHKFDIDENLEDKWFPLYKLIKNIVTDQRLLPVVTEEIVNKWIAEINNMYKEKNTAI